MVIISIQVITILAMIILSSLFASSESAIFSIPHIRILRLKEEGMKGADRLYDLMQKPQDLLLTILIGDFMLLTFFSALTASLMMKIFDPRYLPAIMIVFSLSIVLFKDIIPMAIAARAQERFSLRIIRFIYISNIIFTPIRWFLNFITTKIFRITTYIEEISQKISLEDISQMVEVGFEEGFIDEEERRFVLGIVDIGDEKIDEIMTPRVSFVSIDEEETVGEALDLIKQTDYSRLPVYKAEMENITGVVSTMDLLPYLNKRDLLIKEVIEKPQFSPETMGIIELLKEFKKSRKHLTFVVDEYGTVTGLVTLDDILEEIFGEIIESHDQFHFKFRKLEDDRFIVSGITHIEDFEEITGVNLPNLNVNTIGGYVVSEIGRIPEEGEEFELLSFKVTILSSKPNVIERMLIEKVSDKE